MHRPPARSGSARRRAALVSGCDGGINDVDGTVFPAAVFPEAIDSAPDASAQATYEITRKGDFVGAVTATIDNTGSGMTRHAHRGAGEYQLHESPLHAGPIAPTGAAQLQLPGTSTGLPAGARDILVSARTRHVPAASQP